MTDFSFLADDVLVDALIMEIAGLLGRLIEDGETGSIDLLGLPLSQSCLVALDRRLGKGEVNIRLDAAGHSEICETAYPGVWWTRHNDEAGRVVAMLVEVTFIPAIVRSDIEDMRLAYRRLPQCTSIARQSA
jgi:hydrogenase-1 operon protein HyaF